MVYVITDLLGNHRQTTESSSEGSSNHSYNIAGVFYFNWLVLLGWLFSNQVNVEKQQYSSSA